MDDAQHFEEYAEDDEDSDDAAEMVGEDAGADAGPLSEGSQDDAWASGF